MSYAGYDCFLVAINKMYKKIVNSLLPKQIQYMKCTTQINIYIFLFKLIINQILSETSIFNIYKYCTVEDTQDCHAEH
jgi:hypothetical protein